MRLNIYRTRWLLLGVGVVCAVAVIFLLLGRRSDETRRIELNTKAVFKNWDLLFESPAFINNRLLVSFNIDGDRVALIDAITGSVQSLTINPPCDFATPINMDQAGDLLAIDCRMRAGDRLESIIRLLRVSDGRWLRDLKQEGPAFNHIRHGFFTPDAQQLLTISEDGTNLWRVHDGALVRQLQTKIDIRYLYAAELSEDGEDLLIVHLPDGNPVIERWPLDGSPVTHQRVDVPWRGGRLRFSPHGRLLAMGMGADLVLIDVRTGKPIQRVLALKETSDSALPVSVEQIAFSSDEQWVATVAQNTLTIWNINNAGQIYYPAFTRETADDAGSYDTHREYLGILETGETLFAEITSEEIVLRWFTPR